MTVWPNPAKGKVTIRTEVYSADDVQIVALDGRNVLSQVHILAQNSNETVFDISSLPNGVYLVKLPTKTVKLIKF